MLPLLTHNQLRVSRQQIVLPRLSPGFLREGRGLRVAQISDLHFYEYTSRDFYEGVVEQVNALEPDLLALTGDVIHYGDRYIDMAAEYLGRIRARDGKFAILGNHDYLDTARGNKLAAMLREVGMTVLRNDNASIQAPNGDRLWIVGVEDLYKGVPDIGAAMAGVPSLEEPVLALAHNPLLFDPLLHFPDSRVDLVLSGHTHAGHVYLPWLELVYRRVLGIKYRYGLHEKKGAKLYVTSGLGSAALHILKRKLNIGLPRFRHNTVPEIALLDLLPG